MTPPEVRLVIFLLSENLEGVCSHKNLVMRRNGWGVDILRSDGSKLIGTLTWNGNAIEATGPDHQPVSYYIQDPDCFAPIEKLIEEEWVGAFGLAQAHVT